MRILIFISILCLLLTTQLQGQSYSGQSNPVYYQIGVKQNSAISSANSYSIGVKASSAVSTNSYYQMVSNSVSGTSQAKQYSISNPQTTTAKSDVKYFSIKRAESRPNLIQPTANTPASTSLFEVLPVSNSFNPNTYALIVGNEDYSSYQTGLNREQNVEFAVNDARLFKELCQKSFGIPNENIIYMENAGYVKLKQAITQFNLVAKHSAGKANLIFYYAGHGLPDEQTKVPYIIPVDASGSSLDFTISLPSIYQSLTEYSSNKVVVFLDACFTGGARNMSLVSSRAVKVRPIQEVSVGNNLVIFSSSNSEQASLPYKEKQHGMFTYFLVNKYIENKGDVTLGELENYLITKVPVTSVLVNKTEQVPAVFVSPNIVEKWKSWRIGQ